MIVIDTSAIFAVLFNEAEGAECATVLLAGGPLAISAATLAEAQVVAARAGVTANLQEFLARIGFEVVPVDAAFAASVGPAYARYGKGLHKARLNFGDTFAYVLAKQRGCPLLYIGNDFAMTDVVPAPR